MSILKTGVGGTVTIQLNKNIEDYLFHKPGFLDKDFCKSSLETLRESQWERHDFTGYETNDPEHGFGWTREVKSSPSIPFPLVEP